MYQCYSCTTPTDLVHRVSVVTVRGQYPQRPGDPSAAPLRPTLVSSSCTSILPGPSKIVPSTPDKLGIPRRNLGGCPSLASSSNTSRRCLTFLLGKTTCQGTSLGFLSSVGMMPRPQGHRPCLKVGNGEVLACNKLPIRDLLGTLVKPILLPTLLLD
jgi:hypothetical protein